MPRYTIDRFEGAEWAVLEDERAQTFRIPKRWLPPESREGDILTASEEAAAHGTQSVRFDLDPAARADRLADATRQREQLPRGPKGDISL